MKNILLLIPLLFLPVGASAGGDCVAGFGSPCSDNNIAASKASAKSGAVAGLVYAPSVAAAKIPEQAIAPNPHAAPPSASCWIGASITAAVSEFGIGISGMEWDPICGLWLAAQQVDGEPQNEAATAAFCMTMEKAEVASATCKGWEESQLAAVRLDQDHRANISADITGGDGPWN